MAPAPKKDKIPDRASTLQPDQSNHDEPPPSDREGNQGVPTAERPAANDLQSNTSPNRPPAQPRGSWYAGGSWRSKASPVAQIARENVSVAGGISSESSTQGVARQSVSKSARGSRKSVPLIAEATRVHATSDSNDKSLPERKRLLNEEKQKVSGHRASDDEIAVVEEPKQIPHEPEPEPATTSIDMTKSPGVDDADVKSVDAPSIRPQSGSWLGWWSRPEGYASDADRESTAKRQKIQDPDGDENPPPGPQPQATPLPQAGSSNPTALDGSQTETSADGARDQPKPEMTMNANSSSRSWFGFWSSAQNEQAVVEERQREQNEEQAEPSQDRSDEVDKTSPDQTSTSKALNASKAVEPEAGNASARSAGWAFWSADKPKDSTQSPNVSQKQVGEIAVADTPSQSHPEAAQYNEQQVQDRPSAKKHEALSNNAKGKDAIGAVANKQRKITPSNKATASSAVDSQAQISAAADISTSAEVIEPPAPVQRVGKRVVQLRPNLVLPSFRETYQTEAHPGYLERLTQYLAHTLHLPGAQPIQHSNHVFATAATPKIKKAIAIGVHGFFPAPLVQKLLGPPTGTSVRFANHAAAAIQEWCKEHHPETAKDLQIEKIALEGEGFITDRVSTLWKLLLNWLSHLRQADFILVACHSQGVPVGITLVAKLIQLGCLAPNVRVGVCAMAGINLGPFIEYKSRLFGGSALELFDFCDSQSKVSRAYAESVEVCLRQGVRVTFVGSLDDQLVSLESSLHMPVHHPYVNRAVFIDGRLHALDFLTRLVVFAVKLRNLGISDHGFLREISAPLAGSLVGGEGHSRIYDEPNVYMTAVEFALESTVATPETFASAYASSSIAPTNSSPTTSTDPEQARLAAMQRRASLSGYPPTTALANRMRRGSLSSSSGMQPPGIAPVITPYETTSSSGGGGGAEKNPFVLPWAVRGMLEEELIKRDASMQDQVRLLVKDFEAWRPVTKVLKDVRWRLEGVRSML